jgi:iron complex outermembrane recepter protein
MRQWFLTGANRLACPIQFNELDLHSNKAENKCRNGLRYSLALVLVALPVSASAQATDLSEIVITAAPLDSDVQSLATARVTTSDTASLLTDYAGVSVNTGGGISGLPAIHGLADDRVKVLVDGMESTPACPNHMNPPLSYADPASISKIAVLAGITPVSLGGDSTGGTVIIESAAPQFSMDGQGLLATGSASLFARSVNSSSTAALAATVANSSASLGLTGSTDRAGDYSDGRGDKITSTYFESNNLALTLAARDDANLLVVRVGQQVVPRQGFVNQQLDMVQNLATFFTVGYQRIFGWGKFDARIYGQNTHHEMNIGEDKATFPNPFYMPVDSHGRDFGYSLKAGIALDANNILRVGNEFHGFTLNEDFPPVAGTAPFTAPGTFTNIDNGHRDRLGTFAEWESKWSPRLITLLGVRNDEIWMSTGDVQGYSDLYAVDANVFNAQNHSRHDDNWDLTALSRLDEGSTGTFELGYARKTRSPNLYERYAWSTSFTTSGMINAFGDGNYYVGNLNLRPEIANTLSATADWHDSLRAIWDINATPYYTRVQDYIGVNLIGSTSFGATTFNQLQFANHDAELYGLDMSGNFQIWNDSAFGRGELKGILGYVRGRTLDNGDSLYHLMPLNARWSLEQQWSAWTNALELQLVARKTEVDPLRDEPQTPGYALVNLRTSYEWRNLRFDAGITNLCNRFYFLPLGGVNYDNFLATGATSKIGPLAGQGRSVNAGVTFRF